MKKSFEDLDSIRRVEGEEEPDANEKLPAGLEEYHERAQALLDSHKRFFQTFARDVSLSFKLGNAFYIDLEGGEVNLATQWFKERGYSEEQILWATLHELSHFRDLADDPERMFRNFDYIYSRARSTGSVILEKWEQKYGASDPEFIEQLKKRKPVSKKKPEQTMDSAEAAAYKIYHTLYNVFDDVYVNNLVRRRAPKYEEGQAGGKATETLYREKLFPKNDYSELPRHLQFLYTLLREEMVPVEKVIVKGEVQEALDKKIRFQGKDYSARGIVAHFLKPKKNRDTRAGERYLVIQKTLEPIFDELLKKDLEDWEPKKPEPPEKSGSESGEGDGGEPERTPAEAADPFASEHKEFEESSPDQMSDEEMQDWAEKHEEDKAKEQEKEAGKKREETKTAEEKARESQDKLDKDWSQAHNISRETLQRFRQIEAEVAPYLDDLSALWQRIIFGSTRKIERGMEGHFRTGTELDIQKTIAEWPEIQHGDLDKVEVMKKMVSKEVLVQKPELIRVRLVGDLSGSMDAAKRHILQQCFVLILSSLREFNTYLNLTRPQTKTKLEVDTEAWIFGDAAQKIKSLRSETGIDNEQVDIVKIFEHLEQTIGFTYDNKPLEGILEEFTPEDHEKIEQGKIMEMVFEITDGGSSDATSSKTAVENLLTAGVIARAFQIGEVSAEDRKTFNDVWNKGREDSLGEVVGAKIENLLPAVTALLKDYLRGVRL